MKAIRFIAIVLAAAMIFAGCAQNDAETDEPVQPTADADAVEEVQPEQPDEDAQPDGDADEVADGVSAATMARYDAREIHDYEGIQLDPAVGPRDNSIAGVQDVDIAGYTLEITGLVDTPQTLTYDDVLAMEAHERVITLYCVEGWDATILWKGVRITDLLDLAVPKDAAQIVIFECVDGYTTSIPISTIEERDLLFAYEANTAPLPPEMGYPFIVVAEDKLGYKWARWVTRIILSDDEDYLGFWEERGYENDADIADD